MKKIAVLLHTTFTRFEQAKKTIESFKPYDRFVIYVSDTGAITPEKQRFYNLLECDGHKVFFTGWDTSPAITRNFLTEQIKEDYIFKIDDDFEFRPVELRDQQILTAFDADPSLGLVGFAVKSAKYKSEFIFDIDMPDYEDGGKAMRLTRAKRPTTKVGDVELMYCDVTPDCFIARKEIFPQCWWDERYHVCEGLHTDFFAQIKFNSDWKVAYAPGHTMYTFKHDEEWFQTAAERRKTFYNRKRFRNMTYKGENGSKRNIVDYSKFCDKWGVKDLIK